MSNLVKFPNARKAREDAAEWLVLIEEGLSARQRAEFEDWLGEDPGHPLALIQMARTWDRFGALSALAAAFPLEPPPAVAARRFRLARIAVGLSAVVAIVVPALWVLSELAPMRVEPLAPLTLPKWENGVVAGDVGGQGSAPTHVKRYETAVGEQLSARLPDGSVVTLNTDTAISVRYAETRREVVLERGECSFNVAADPDRPFSVDAGARVVEAVGTVFNIERSAADDLEVTVSEGSVRVLDPASITSEAPSASRRRAARAARGETTVVAGQLAMIERSAVSVRFVEAAEIEAALAWHQGVLVFRGEPLETVLAEVSRYTNVEFEIVDDSIRGRPVGGYFRTGEIDAVLLALRESFGIRLTREGNRITLSEQR
jgi:transmembrane sensor